MHIACAYLHEWVVCEAVCCKINPIREYYVALCETHRVLAYLMRTAVVILKISNDQKQNKEK
jgi:hypothetical protein